MDEAFQVRALREDDDVSAITRLLHAAYAPLAEMGFRYLASHQKDDVTLRRLRQGFAFVGVMSGQIVATLTLRPPDPDSPCAWYPRTLMWCRAGWEVWVGVGFDIVILIQPLHAPRQHLFRLKPTPAFGMPVPKTLNP